MKLVTGGSVRQAEQTAFVELGERLSQALLPVKANSAFVRSLRSELVDGARHQVVADHESRRTALIAAAAVGSLISVASVIGAVVYLVTRRRGQVRPAGA